ncbi:hypothetical protein P879_05053 [Paragonimus westermani]|uniref:Myotubularin phosphatase domain-containing protein n=1 Tax=Paragonimus westermani TaxID=34504 RepID=A0A8T0D0X8_9TREM|nr:hypothetical protein P879_05053 [Paragonimus westermani]
MAVCPSQRKVLWRGFFNGPSRCQYARVMYDAQDWCCCFYEVPYRGVSFHNPAGHLITALRNRGEQRTWGEAFSKLQRCASFQHTADQSLLQGVLGIMPWQLIFIPCINRNEMCQRDTEAVRRTVMRSLRQTEPGFRNTWTTGCPGSIPIARIDYIIAVDRHKRLYKFDPVRSIWCPTTDGVKRPVSDRLRSESKEIHRTFSRILLFTTDFEVYAFQLCTPVLQRVNSTSNAETTSCERDAKRMLRSFVNQLTARVSFIRSSSGIEIASSYANNNRAKTSSLPTPLPQTPLTSLDPFNIATAPDPLEQDGKLNLNHPINRNPVHPTARLHEFWFDGLPPDRTDDRAAPRWIENTGFSYCRTYPLQVPSVPFHSSLMRTRLFFDGHRFPVVSYLHTAEPPSVDQSQGSNVWLLRSGCLINRNDLDSIVDCGHQSGKVVNSSSSACLPNRLIHIRLSETSFNLVKDTIDFGLINHVDESPRLNALFSTTPSSGPIPSPDCSPLARWYVSPSPDICSSSSSSNESSQIPGDCRKMETSKLESVDAFLDWPTPRAQFLRSAWLRLGSLARLPQIYVPGSDNINPKKVTNSTSRRSVVTTSVDMLHLLSHAVKNRSTGSLECMETDFPFSTANPLFSGKHSAGKLSEESRSSRCLSVLATDNEVSRGTDTLLSTSVLTSKMRLQRSLGSLASEHSPHRSAWHDNFYATKWLMLMTICLKQAVQLAELIDHLSTNPRSPSTDDYLLLTGPKSGRVWQPIITSLAQLILQPSTRSLIGFENLIEREWIRLGYPFAPDPADWFDASVPSDYDGGASFALFIDCVHQLLFLFPVDFAFTEDYLVVLLDTALSRGGPLPPFAIEFACSCEAARCVSTKARSPAEVAKESDRLFQRGALRSFRDWSHVLTPDGLGLLGNWWYWWHTSPNPLKIVENNFGTSTSIKPLQVASSKLLPIPSSLFYMRCWIHGWFRWNRPLRLSNGGGYAFNAAFHRNCLSNLNRKQTDTDESCSSVFPHPSSSATPYTGWMSDEAILSSESQSDVIFLHQLLSADPCLKFVQIASRWELSLDPSVN